DTALAAAVAREVPVTLAGGMSPSTVGQALLQVPAVGVDAASGTEGPRIHGVRPVKDPLRVALLVKRARDARRHRPNGAARAAPGAGRHGVATATACALLGLPCVVFMGEEDIRRQAPNVLRMRALGAEVRSVTSGTATLKDAVNEAMRDWVTNVETTHYVLGSAMGPHPYPTIVRDLQRRIGDEAAAQLHAVEDRLPDLALACVGGGSNASGLLARFIGEPSVRL